MYIYNLNQQKNVKSMSKSLATQINLLMYGTHGILNLILQSVNKYISCARDGSHTLMACYFDIICVQTRHLLSLNSLMGNRAMFLPYESNALCCLGEKCYKKPIYKKVLVADTIVCQRLLLKDYKRVAQSCKNEPLKQVLFSHIRQNQKLLFNLRQKIV